MILHVQQAKHVHDYVIWLRFNDGAEGEIDLLGELDGEMFAPLKDLEAFKSFRVDPDLGAIVWQNGADLAPEFLYENMNVLAWRADALHVICVAYLDHPPYLPIPFCTLP